MSTIITRAGKGSPLTSTEVDSNFTNLNTDKVEKAGTDPVSISVNSASDALRITQIGAGNAFLVEDEANPDATPFAITNDGSIITGNATTVLNLNPANGLEGVSRIQAVGTNSLGTMLAGTVYNTANTTVSAPYLSLGRSNTATIGGDGIVSNGDLIGGAVFHANDGTAQKAAAYIQSFVDGAPGTNDMPGRLVISTSTDGTSTPTEKFRVTNGGVLPFFQPNPTAVNATATLTIAQINTKIITSTTALAVTMTLPTGTLMDGGFSALSANMGFDWVVINTGATNAVTIGAGTTHTVVGNMTVNPLQSATFRSRKTAANTFVTYRIT